MNKKTSIAVITNKLLKNFLILYSLTFLLAVNNTLKGQSCNDPCNSQITIPNHDFEQFDFNCFDDPNGPGYSGFFCVDHWDVAAVTPDIWSPDFNTTQPFSPILSSLLTSTVAGLCYGNPNQFIVHSEAIVNTSIVFPSAPNVSYNVSIDVAAMSSENPGFNNLLDIEQGALWVQVSDDNSESIIVDNSFNITTGWQTVCFEGLLASGLDAQLKISSQTINVTPDRINSILIDNVSMNCEIDNANLNIQSSIITDLQHEFDLIQVDPNLYASNVASVEWDFGDGNTSFDLNPQHTYVSSGLYTVTAFIKDESGCCTALSKEIEAIDTEGCGTVTLSGTSSLFDLYSALFINPTDGLSDAVATVEIDGTLEINENVTFGENINFLLTSGSSIEVNSNIRMTKNGGFIGACEDNFESVFLHDRASLSIENVTIWGANKAVRLGVNSTLNSIDCFFEDSTYGIYIDGKGKIETFKGNNIINCQFGINAESSGNLIIEDQDTNYFTDCEMGIRTWKTRSTISHCQFNNCQFGIFFHKSPAWSRITDNTINATETGIALIQSSNISTRIEGNDIGSGDQTPRYGIYASNSSIWVENNIAIQATWRGIVAYSPIAFRVSNNENIYVSGDDATGVYVNIAGGSTDQIKNNTISGRMKDNIFCNVCDDNFDIANNDLSGATDHGIAMQGGGGSRILSNIIRTEPWKGIGLYGHNNSRITDNYINAISEGLLISNNSQTQEIACNTFASGNKDIVTKSVLGPQFYRRNQFRKIGSKAFSDGLSLTEVEESRFTVGNCTPTLTLCPYPEQWEREGFFLIESIDVPITQCAGDSPNDIGTPPGPGDDYWCWLFAQFESIKKTNPIKSWVNRYKALKINSFKKEGLIPRDCIVYDEHYCKMDEFINIELSVRDLIKNTSATDNSYEIIENGIESRIAVLDQLDCHNYIFKLYKKTYISVLKDMIGKELSLNEIKDVKETAALCAHIYGDVVYWARGILDHRGEVRSYDDESCNTKMTEEVKVRSKKDVMNNEIVISPNPASNYIKLENKTNFDQLEVSLTDLFGRVYEVVDKLEYELNIDCSKFNSGIYFVTIKHSSGYLSVKRVIINN